MVAELVHHDDEVALAVGQHLIEVVGQNLVETAFAVAQPRHLGAVEFLRLDAGAHALAARLVVAPKHTQTGALKDVEQGLAAADLVLVVIAAPLQREHAGQGNLGVGAATRDLGEIDHVALGELRRRLPRVAGEAPVGGTRRFADDDHEQRRLLARLPARGERRVQPDLLPFAGGRAGVGTEHAGQRIEVVGRGDEVAHFLVVAHQGRHVLEDRDQRSAQDQHAENQAQRTPQQRRTPGVAHHAHPGQQQERQQAIEHEVRQHAQAEQLTRFLDVGAQHVAQHARIKEDGVARHVVAGKSRGDEDHRQQRLGRPAVAEDEQDEEMQRRQGDEQAGGKQPVAGASEVALGERGAPEESVAAQGEEQAGKQGQRLDAQGGSPPAPVPEGGRS